MSNYVYYKPKKKVILPFTETIMSRESYQAEELLRIFLEETKRHYYTTMSFSSRIAGVREQQAQQQNYDYFVHTMAEMIQKYAPEIIN